jgi:hypothetical protein
MTREFEERLSGLENAYYEQISKPNEKAGLGNGVYNRYINPVLTAAHTPVFWRYDLNPQTNPYLMERFGINAVFNAGAIKWQGKYMMMARVEGLDRKSFFAIAGRPGHECIRHTFNRTPGRLDIWHILHRKARSCSAGLRSVDGGGSLRYCPYQRFCKMGTPA